MTHEGLIYGEPDIKRALAASPYQLVDVHLAAAQQPPDPIRFFRGLPASLAHVRDGWGILRAVKVDDRISQFHDFIDAFGTGGPESVFLLEAGPGEGKTTFLQQVAWYLRDSTVTLRWFNFEEHKP